MWWFGPFLTWDWAELIYSLSFTFVLTCTVHIIFLSMILSWPLAFMNQEDFRCRIWICSMRDSMIRCSCSFQTFSAVSKPVIWVADSHFLVADRVSRCQPVWVYSNSATSSQLLSSNSSQAATCCSACVPTVFVNILSYTPLHCLSSQLSYNCTCLFLGIIHIWPYDCEAAMRF